MALQLAATLVIDCNNISCLTFTDTTGGYSTSNTGGYGTPNPAISDIATINFTITDADGNDFVFQDSGYRPNSAGNSSVCLQASDFLDGITPIVFIAGATYALFYSVDFGASNAEIQQNFTFPCCGSGVTSNIRTNFDVTETLSQDRLIFNDSTGSYNASTNTGGYGTPNPAYGDIVSTLIRITLEDGTVVDITSFIPTVSDHSTIITASDLGYTYGIPDQIINIEYSVYAAGVCRIGYKNQSVLLYSQTQVCILEKTALLLASDCSCSESDSTQTDNIMKMWFELDAIKITAQRNIGCVTGKIQTLLQKCSAGCSNC